MTSEFFKCKLSCENKNKIVVSKLIMIDNLSMWKLKKFLLLKLFSNCSRYNQNM